MGSSQQASQLGLFSTQVAEQIHRLRSLGEGGAPGEPASLRAKRAIMATRLLGGSARLLEVAPLQAFLEELLAWLQAVEGRGSQLGSSQALVLDSVIELEEQLLRRLEQAGDRLELGEIQAELEELQVLVRRDRANQSRPRPATPVVEQLSGPVQPLAPGPAVAPPAGPEAPATPEPPAPVPLPQLLSAVERRILLLREAGELDGERGRLEAWWRRVGEILDAPRAEAPVGDAAEPAAVPGGTPGAVDRLDAQPSAPAIPLDHEDPVLAPALKAVAEQADELGSPVFVEHAGGARLVGKGVQEIVAQVLRHLALDSMRVFGMLEDEGRPPAQGHHLRLELRREGSILQLLVLDDAPPVSEDDDHLGLYRGLRASHDLIEQLSGLLEVEPRDGDGCRFRVQLPAALGRLSYQLFEVEGATVAVPAVMVDRELDPSTLLYESDNSGESFHLDGRVVPLVDLAAHVPSVMPTDAALGVLLVGHVEKRLGLYVGAARGTQVGEDIGDAPAGWEEVAYGSLPTDGGPVPILDVERLLSLRFRGGDDLAGSGHDESLSSYVPLDQTQRIEPIGSTPNAGRRALLVNQSAFRRKELGRVLQELGYAVTAVPDLLTARQCLQDGEGADVLITDLRLGQEGGESLARLRELTGDMPVVLTSSVAREYAEELARRAGANHCWLDPFRGAELEALLAPRS